MKTLLIILIGLFSLSLYSQKNKFYQRDESNSFWIKYSAIKITFKEFKEAIETVEYYVTESEREADSTGKITLKCEFTQGNETEMVASFEEIRNLLLEKTYYTEVRFQYYTEKHSVPISTVGIYFSKFTNSVHILGGDDRKINALCRALDDQIRPHEAVVSRFDIQSMLTLLIYAMCVGLVIYLGYNQKKIQPAISRRGFYILLTSLGIFFLASNYAISCLSKSWFPNLSFTAENANWYRRNEITINLISFALGILSWIPIVIGWVKSRIRRQIKKELQGIVSDQANNV